jgi:hypothetical protein
MSDTLINAVTGAGVLIRYSFYLIGAIVAGMIGLGIMSLYSGRTRTVDERASFHIASSQLTRLPSRSQTVTGSRFGRLELLQYGALHNRDVNFSIGMGFPPSGALITADTMPQVASLMPRNMRSVMSASYYDLETRFGPARATEMRIESDGQWKQCLAFASRFDTTAVYLMGWFCDASGAKPNAGTLACALDKLTLNKDLAFEDANAFIRAKMVRPASCSAIPVSQTTDTRYRTRVAPPQNWSVPNAQRRNY